MYDVNNTSAQFEYGYGVINKFIDFHMAEEGYANLAKLCDLKMALEGMRSAMYATELELLRRLVDEREKEKKNATK